LQVNLRPVENYGPPWGAASMRQPQNPQDDSPLVIENVHPGRYRVQVNTPVGFASSITSGGIDLLNLPLAVPAGGAISPIEITLRDDGAEVEGAVENANSPGSPSSLQGQAISFPSLGNNGQFRGCLAFPRGQISTAPTAARCISRPCIQSSGNLIWNTRTRKP